MLSNTVLVLLPTLATSFSWGNWQNGNTAQAQVFQQPAQVFQQPAQVFQQQPAQVFPTGGATITGAAVFANGQQFQQRTAPATTVASSLAGGGFNLGVSSLCGKGADGCGIISNPNAASRVTNPIPVPQPLPVPVVPANNRIFGNNSDGCDRFGKSGKSKGYNGNNPNCCGSGSKSKGNRSGSCGKSKGGKSGGRSRTVNYEALASGAPETAAFASSWTMVVMATSLVVAVSMLW